MTVKESLLAQIDELELHQGLSMGVWVPYWRARILLRQFAFEQYQAVTKAYAEKKMDVWFPNEGFKEIANDVNKCMVVVNGGPL